MRTLSKEEKQLLKKLSSKDSLVDLVDFFKVGWPGGKLEVSTFQQTLSIQVTDEQLPVVMNHIVERLNLLKALEQEGYVNLWSQIPSMDNMKSIGESLEGSNVILLPDILVATDVLKYANFKIGFSKSLKAQVKRNFQRQPYTIFKVLAIAVILMIIADIAYHARILGINIGSDHQQIVDNNSEILANQLLGNQIIDSLRAQNDELMLITSRISENTENIEALNYRIGQQQETLNEFRKGSNKLVHMLEQNQKILLKSDSLIRSFPKNK
ncbi:hypothetical protein [Ekhidna sp.]|uniref:hypothetical protein n=1 Tax=Ekhidna sp. TaxID=2608089 RepID=UPI003CCBA031